MKKALKDRSDEELVAAIRRTPGDKALWEALFRSLQQRLYSMALRACDGNREDAEDLLQEIQIELIDALLRYEARGGAKVWTYIWRIAKNRCAARFHREQRVAGIFVHRGDNDGQDFIENAASASANPLDLVLDKELNEQRSVEVASLISQRLKPHFWKVIKWFHLEKRSHRSIAAELEITEGNSRKRVFDAITALRRICREYQLDADELRVGIRRLYHHEMS